MEKDKMRLELKHLAPYAPYKLKVQLGGTTRDLTAISCDGVFLFVTAWQGSRERQMAGIDNIKPILRPLSDLTKEIEHNGEMFVPIKRIEELSLGSLPASLSYKWMYYQQIEQLLEWHFDIFNLISKNLAIDINKL